MVVNTESGKATIANRIHLTYKHRQFIVLRNHYNRFQGSHRRIIFRNIKGIDTTDQRFRSLFHFCCIARIYFNWFQAIFSKRFFRMIHVHHRVGFTGIIDDAHFFRLWEKFFNGTNRTLDGFRMRIRSSGYVFPRLF